ncbi:MAG: hypothetical protein CMJ49_06720 [Planctomycetaceae bacterium]|nr:hypothetical protein [Planctomycetaceae bacterium]
MRRVRLFVTIVILILILVGVGLYVWVRRTPETTPAIRGEAVARRLGCFGCHGPQGQGGVSDPTSPGGAIVDWHYATTKMFISSEQDIREWILYGKPTNATARLAIDDHATLVPMPAYQGLLSDRELDDLVAYFLAVSGWRDEIPDDAYEGRKIAQRLGCFGCHGPSGMGGVPNPRSFKGHIPPWDGKEFDELVQDDDELREWILEGKTERLWNNPAARFFLERQSTPMPAYHDHLSDAELELLVKYINWLREDRTEPDSRRAAPETVIGTIPVRSR